MPLPTKHEELQELLENMEIPLLFQSALESLFRQPALLDVKVDDKLLLSNVSEAFSATCYSMRNTHKFALAKLGVSPGDQLSDVVYNPSARPMIDELNAGTSELGYAPDIISQGQPRATVRAAAVMGIDLTAKCSGVSYVDDLAKTAILPQHARLSDAIPNL